MGAITSVVNRYYDPTTDQFLSVDPDVATTDQPYVFTNDDSLNAEDPLGNITCGIWLPGCGLITDLQHHWRGAAQVVTIGVGGFADAACTISVVCDVWGNATIGAATGDAVYAESGGKHTAKGFAEASAIGALSALAPIALATMGIAGESVLIVIAVNSGIGSASGLAGYLTTPGKHTIAGMLRAAGLGAVQGSIPYSRILKIIKSK